jgi:hypothetical protein
MSYLPLAHIFDRVVEELFMFHGASIGFWRGVSIITCTHNTSWGISFGSLLTFKIWYRMLSYWLRILGH